MLVERDGMVITGRDISRYGCLRTSCMSATRIGKAWRENMSISYTGHAASSMIYSINRFKSLHN